MIFAGGTLNKLALQVANAISKIQGVYQVNNGITPAGDALNIEVDHVKVALEGMDPDTVTQAVNEFLSGKVTTTVQQGPKLIGVRVWTPKGDRKTERGMSNMLLRAPDGHSFPLKRVATFVPLSGQSEITRDDLKRMVAVTARIIGRDLGSTIREVKIALDRPGVLPDGFQPPGQTGSK